MRRSRIHPSVLAVLLLLVAAAPMQAPMQGCGGATTPLPDYSEWMHAGVDPRTESAALVEGLERAGFLVTKRLETDRWIAIEARRDPDQRAIRVVTSRGGALVLDSHETDGVQVRHGEIALLDPPHAPSHDLDGDGTDEVVVAARSGDRDCALPFRIGEDGVVAPLLPDLRHLGDDVCVEAFRDLDADGRLEGIAVLRYPGLGRGEIPAIEVPVEIDATGRLRAAAPAISYLAQQRGAREGAIDDAIRAARPETVYRIAIELAALSRLDGGSRETQVRVFDAAIGRAVLTRDMVPDVLAARAFIQADWQLPTTE